MRVTQQDIDFLTTCLNDGSQKAMIKFYQSKVWRSTRQAVLVRDNYECVHCKDRGIVTTYGTLRRAGKRPKLDVNHKLPLKQYPHLAYDMSNLETLCVDCHNVADNKYAVMTAQRDAQRKAKQEVLDAQFIETF